MNILEKDIEQLVYEAALKSPEKLFDKGLDLWALNCNPAVIRQFNLGNYGIMDLVFIHIDPADREYQIIILELKKDCIDYKTLDQSLKYKKGIETYMSIFHPKCIYKIQICLIGRTLDLENSNICFIPDLFKGIVFFTYSLDFEEGLKFNQIKGYNVNKPNLSKVSGVAGDAIKKHIYATYRNVYKHQYL